MTCDNCKFWILPDKFCCEHIKITEGSYVCDKWQKEEN